MKKRLRHPIRAIREPFGTAGLIVAVVALIAAVGGTALAAGGLTAKQEKQVIKIAKKYAGKPGPKGDTGAPGANGSPGAPGANGTSGKSVVTSAASGTECAGGVGGTKFEVEGSGTPSHVCNGKEGKEGKKGEEGSPWTAGGVLPSKETETGAWSVALNGKWGFPEAATSISFPIPLAAEAQQAAFVFDEIETEGEEFGKVEEGGTFSKKGCKVGDPECLDTGCRGSLLNPTAPPGVLCIYTDFHNFELTVGKRFEAKAPEQFAESNSYGKTGTFLIGIGSLEEGAFVSSGGTWAVTAP